MKPLGEFNFLQDRMLDHRRVPPYTELNHRYPLYTWEERSNMKVKCPRKYNTLLTTTEG